jgi:hypothetical protein
LIKAWRAHSHRAQGKLDVHEWIKTKWLYRGMKGFTLEAFKEHGGTELAPMSTSASKEVAMR